MAAYAAAANIQATVMMPTDTPQVPYPTLSHPIDIAILPPPLTMIIIVVLSYSSYLKANYIESRVCGADVVLVDGLINDCARIISENKTKEGWFDVSTLKEPYRVEV